jgi:hypothetical protein
MRDAVQMGIRWIWVQRRFLRGSLHAPDALLGVGPVRQAASMRSRLR